MERENSSFRNRNLLPSTVLNEADSLDKLIARLGNGCNNGTRVNFYESSVEQLKKELPKYLQQQSELEKCHSSFSKTIKSIASSEPHNLLQYFLFSYAQKEEEIASLQQDLYTNLLPLSKEILDSWTKKLIVPIRDVIEDHLAYHKNNPNAKDGPLVPLPPSLPTNPSASVASAPPAPANEPNNLQSLKSLLPIHAKLFEKHRIQESKRLFKQLLLREIQFHAVALESYSQLLECLSEIEEQEIIHWNNYYSLSSQTSQPPPTLSQSQTTATAATPTSMK